MSLKASPKCVRVRAERGVQLLELTLSLAILLALLAAVSEFGQYFYTYTSLAKATRASARYLASKTYSSTTIENARNIAVCGQPASCDSLTPVISGLTKNNIQITSTGSAIFPTTVTVKIVGYNYQSTLGFGQFLLNGIQVDPSTTMRYTLSN